MRTTAYRYPNERLILAVTLLLVFVVIALTVTATVCASLLFFIGFVLLSYYLSRSHHQSLIHSAQRVTTQKQPEVARLVTQSASRLQPGPIEVYIAPSRNLNAYTFGLSSPKVVVLYSKLFEIMDADELLFILGHELGHVALGHTWLNSLVGGMAGIPSPWGAAVLLSMAFLWWNRACEFSADRAGLLACGKPDKAISALIKLAAGPEARTSYDLELAYQRIDAQDDTWMGSLEETQGTHPLLIRRIQQIQKFADSAQYKQILIRLNHAT